jgi:AcrR family transcriptional regulator
MKEKAIKAKAKGHKRIEQGKKTSADLIRIARQMFSRRGYANSSMEEIVLKAGVTRGALYHHFSSKEGLFLAVFENAQAEIASRIYQASKDQRSAWGKLVSSTFAFFEACSEPELQQIVLIDAPVVLGWNVWRRVDEAKTHDTLRSLLKELIDTKVIQPLPLRPIAHLIAGAANEAVLFIAQSEDPKKTFKETWSAMETLLRSLRR